MMCEADAQDMSNGVVQRSRNGNDVKARKNGRGDERGNGDMAGEKATTNKHDSELRKARNRARTEQIKQAKRDAGKTP